VESAVKTRLQWIAIVAFAALSTTLPPSLRNACLLVTNGAAMAQRVDALAKAALRYTASHPPGRPS
jgi:hypothetical protein